MLINLKIDNPDMEKELTHFVKQHQELSVEALRSFLNTFPKKKKFEFKKKDPRKHSHEITYIDEEDEDLSDVKPYAHIEDSGQYIHDLRRKRNR